MHRKTHDIAGVTYSILGNCSIIVSGRIAAKLAPLVPVALDAAKGSVDQLDSGDETKMTLAIVKIIAKLDTELIYDAAFQIIAHCKCFAAAKSGEIQLSDASGNVNNAMIDKHFSDYPANLFPFLVWVLKEELGGFFDFGVGKSYLSSTEE